MPSIQFVLRPQHINGCGLANKSYLISEYNVFLPGIALIKTLDLQTILAEDSSILSENSRNYLAGCR